MTNKTEVLYNSSCPIFRREIEYHAKLSEKSALPISYDDLGDPDKLAAWGITAEDAAKRLHVRKDGQTCGGLPAFIVLWQEIPQTRWLAKLCRLPGVRQLGARIYDCVLAPLLYRWHLFRRRAGDARSFIDW